MRDFIFVAATVVVWTGTTAAFWNLAGRVVGYPLPRAVVGALEERFPESRVTQCRMARKDGQACYELSARQCLPPHPPRRIRLAVTCFGEVVRVERTIEICEIPPLVAQAIRANYPQGRVSGATEILTHGRFLWYQLEIKTPAGSLKVECSRQGTVRAANPAV